MLDISDVILRLGAAALSGAAIGLNRDLHGKPTGARTLGLVALGAAVVTVATVDAVGQAGADKGDLSRIMQGLLTGIGFLGAGVIIHHEARRRVEGLTTAASIWGASILGLSCGIGRIALAGIATFAVMLVLVFGGPIERWLERRFATPENGAGGETTDKPPARDVAS
jgi:putative Mg2+ transporter-C (MgtC) family protein